MCLPYNLLPLEYGAVFADSLVAVLCFAAATHTSTEAAAHSFFKAVLTAANCSFFNCLEHWHRTAGVEVCIAHILHSVGYKAFYDEAKNEQAQLEERIMKLENMIRKAVIIDESKIDSNIVTIGSIVTVNDMEFEEEVEYTIVGSAEADPYEGKISNESPVGKALLGRAKGEIVDVQVPDGVVKFEILEIRR